MKVVFNIAFTPSKPRRGASEIENARWNNERKFYNLTAKYNYVSYSLNGVKTAKNKSILDYMQKDTGAFNLDGPLSQEQLDSIKERLATTQSNIWHGWISFDEMTSQGFKTPEQAQLFLKRTFAALFEKSHLNQKNIELMASLHIDTAHHHHIHFSFWEKEATRLKEGERVFSTKGCFSQKCIDNYIIAAGLQLDEHQEDYHIARDSAIARIHELMPAAHQPRRRKEIGTKLAELAKKLPDSGRLGYNSKNMKALRKDINATVEYIAARDEKLKELMLNAYSEIAKREKLALQLAKEGGIVWTQNAWLGPKQVKGDSAEAKYKKHEVKGDMFACVEKLKTDLQARLGQVVIGAAKSIKNGFEKNAVFCKNAARIAARRDRALIKREVGKFLYYTESMVASVQTDFHEKLAEAEYEIAYDRQYGSKGV